MSGIQSSASRQPHTGHICGIVPPYLLARLATVNDPKFQAAALAARRSLLHDRPMREVRQVQQVQQVQQQIISTTSTQGAQLTSTPQRSIFDAAGRETLPGTLVRSEGEPATSDIAVTEAYDGLGYTFTMFLDAFSRASIDGAGLPLDATVHYGIEYDNAFWNGERMVFGDGDGEVFTRFTASLSVIGHELTHGVTQFTANLEYRGQSGALNESVSDVFGALVEQHAHTQNSAEASWLIGEGLFTPAVQGAALRSLKAPGTAYDDDVLGKDPQPANMADFVVTADDNGGVHINSGIPNHAFYLVAEALGGYAWEAPGQIWYDTLTSSTLSATVDFAGFAAATVAAATDRYGDGSPERDAVIAAWNSVGIPLAQFVASGEEQLIT
ncbi:M4 family metallopeptidase [Leifsonia sp. A12D58]|uniref:M4 family metallopeptidase n=1 Tax=Leifsonia sp. A12D58 TaxID=3397674 RepID=UPI0039E07337